jgi:hypothetical protein
MKHLNIYVEVQLSIDTVTFSDYYSSLLVELKPGAMTLAILTEIHQSCYHLMSCRVSQEERSVFWEIIVSVILSEKVFIYVCPTSNSFWVRAITLYRNLVLVPNIDLPSQHTAPVSEHVNWAESLGSWTLFMSTFLKTVKRNWICFCPRVREMSHLLCCILLGRWLMLTLAFLKSMNCANVVTWTINTSIRNCVISLINNFGLYSKISLYLDGIG